MIDVWVNTIISVFVVSLISLVGILTISINMERLKKFLHVLVSFAAGTLLGSAFIHLLPEVFGDPEIVKLAPYIILLGIIIFFVLEKILHWYHCHEPTSEDHPHPVAVNNIIGDGVHNLIDGMVIAASYMVSVPLGIATTLAIVLHEIPQEIGDFGILLHAGFSKKKALFFNYLSATLAIIGAVLTLIIGSSLTNTKDYLIAFTIGGFIYIAAADLMPELKKEEDLKKSLLQLIVFLFGIGVMALLPLLE